MSITWTCMICGEERPDRLISVASGSITLPRSGVQMQQNVRYCNDRPECRLAAEAKAATPPHWADDA